VVVVGSRVDLCLLCRDTVANFPRFAQNLMLVVVVVVVVVSRVNLCLLCLDTVDTQILLIVLISMEQSSF
jgi:hypothetical protein